MVRCRMPIDLSGDNLGLRHRHLNTLVNEAYKGRVRFKKIRDRPEATPVDRLFKIDLASKVKNVDYILQNIKDEDMLYVSRALKAKWIVGQKYEDIINPEYLEENLYPYMITTAVSKFKNWLYLNLKDPLRCEGFYKFYLKTNFNYAIKFLGHCNNKFILSEVSKVLEKLTPHNFKILCEKCPQVAKVYFDNMPNRDQLKTKFLDNEEEFYNSLKVVLKLDADIFFEITEKYFDHKYSRSFTKHIMKVHRNRFDKKPELYAGLLLNMQTLAECLSSEECKELVLKLARATYISHNVDYKFVEPLIKRLPVDERAAFKKRVFVAKDVGDLVKAWPYETPSMPNRNPYKNHVFRDAIQPNLHDFCMYEDFSSMLTKTKCARFSKQLCFSTVQYCQTRCRRTYLDKLFDEYRFISFERTLFELRRRIKEESLSQSRQFMLLVLVSKSGGQPELVASLLQLLEQLSNEPANVRAAVIRSLVKRAAVWRLPQPSWEAMLKFAWGLGLDGGIPDADCREGLHAVVIRSLLETGTCDVAIRNAFINDFSVLDEYTTNDNERNVIRDKISELLLAAADVELRPLRRAELLTSLLDLLQTYNVDVGSSRLIPAVAALQKRDPPAAKMLLLRLFNAKIARRTLFQEIFPLIQTDASYLNALRHDISVLDVSTFIDLIEKNEIRPEQFLRKMAIYFAESSGLMQCYLKELKGRVANNPSVGISMARPLGLLQGASSISYIETLNVTNEHVARLVAAIRANMHAGRPKLYLRRKAFLTVGTKAIANKVMICPTVDIKNYVEELLRSRRTVRLSVILAERIGKATNTFFDASNLRPTAMVKPAIRSIRRRQNETDKRMWRLTEMLILHSNLDSDPRVYLRDFLSNTENIPLKIKPDYCAVVYIALKVPNYYQAMRLLSEIEHFLPAIHEDFVENLLLDFLNEFEYNYHERNSLCISLYLRIFVKYILLSKTEAIQRRRWTTHGEPFFLIIEMCREKFKKEFMGIFEEILSVLQYNDVFFDQTIISPLPIFKNIITWMRQYLPVELHFNLYLRIHLTMLYLKSVRFAVLSQPNVFYTEKGKMNEGVTIVGHIFGIKIAREIKKLMERYFASAIELYRTGMEDYFRNYFKYDVSKFQFMKAVIQGMLQGSTGEEVRITLYLLKSEYESYEKEDREELLADMNKVVDDNFKYFLYPELSDLRT